MRPRFEGVLGRGKTAGEQEGLRKSERYHAFRSGTQSEGQCRHASGSGLVVLAVGETKVVVCCHSAPSPMREADLTHCPWHVLMTAQGICVR